jgi:hypothetical protein
MTGSVDPKIQITAGRPPLPSGLSYLVVFGM